MGCLVSYRNIGENFVFLKVYKEKTRGKKLYGLKFDIQFPTNGRLQGCIKISWRKRKKNWIFLFVSRERKIDVHKFHGKNKKNSQTLV